MKININDISQGLPGLTATSGKHLFEACVVCLNRQNHNHNGTKLSVYGDKKIDFTLTWDNIFDDQLDRTWADQFYATEHGAVCLAILLALKLTDYTIIEKSARKNGFDYYNPKTGTVESGGKGDIAMWMLDTDYDGRSIFPSQVFFPMASAKEGWATLAKNLKAEIDEEKIQTFNGTVSLPITPGKAAAVKIIDARGIESLKIIRR